MYSKRQRKWLHYSPVLVYIARNDLVFSLLFYIIQQPCGKNKRSLKVFPIKLDFKHQMIMAAHQNRTLVKGIHRLKQNG